MLELADDEIEVIPFLLDENDAIPLSEAEAWLSGDERERAAAFRFQVHRERYIRGRGMMRRCLAEHLGRPPGTLEFFTGERGKPHLAGEELHFNLSHSEDHAALAISRLPSVGIDVERFDREVDIDGLSRRCFRQSECERLRLLDPDEKQRAFFWTWTAKEARMKATGEGFGLEPQKIEISFRGEWPEICLEPESPRAFVAPVVFPGRPVACTVAATSPFRVRVREA
jgi:4'-phosphopantetheinyl transferase